MPPRGASGAAAKTEDRKPEAPALVGAPGTKPYRALTAVSIPQRTEQGLATGQNDLAMPGDVVHLTDAEARNLMAYGPRHGRMRPAVAPLQDAPNADVPRIHPSQLSGPIRRPPPPDPNNPDSTVPRPDPPGASRLLVQSRIPEGGDPLGGEEMGELGHLGGGAIDIQPGTART